MALIFLRERRLTRPAGDWLKLADGQLEAQAEAQAEMQAV